MHMSKGAHFDYPLTPTDNELLNVYILKRQSTRRKAHIQRMDGVENRGVYIEPRELPVTLTNTYLPVRNSDFRHDKISKFFVLEEKL
jgi:hypothetical protein